MSGDSLLVVKDVSISPVSALKAKHSVPGSYLCVVELSWMVGLCVSTYMFVCESL